MIQEQESAKECVSVYTEFRLQDSWSKKFKKEESLALSDL